MPTMKEKLLENIKGRDVSELVEDHIHDISLDEKTNTITLFIDKRYIINLLQTHRFIEPLIDGIKKTFGNELAVTLRLANPHHAHDREMLIPHTVHYG